MRLKYVYTASVYFILETWRMACFSVAFFLLDIRQRSPLIHSTLISPLLTMSHSTTDMYEQWYDFRNPVTISSPVKSSSCASIQVLLPVYPPCAWHASGHRLWLRWLRICPQCRRERGFNPWVGKIPWRRKWQPTSTFLPRESHGQRSLAGYGPWGHKELDLTEWQMLSLPLFTHVRGTRLDIEGTQ